MTVTEINENTHAAVAAYHAGDRSAAAHLCRRIVAAMPTHPYALNLLAVMAMEDAQWDAALQLFEAALTADPSSEQALGNLRVCIARMGQLTGESQEAYLQRQLAYAKRFAPLRHYEAWLNLAIHYFHAGRLTDAIAVYQDAAVHGMQSEILSGNLGAHLQDLGRWGEAEDAYRLALSLNAHHAGTLYNLGHLLSLQQRHIEAEQALRQAIHVSPDYADAYVSLGHLLAQAGSLDESMACFRKAMAIAPHSTVPPTALLFNLAYDPATTAADMLACAKLATAHMPLAGAIPPEQHNPQNAKLRIGFVSGDLKDHPVGYFLENLLRHVNRERFEWHVFSNFESNDAVATRLRTLATSWSSIANQSDEWAQQAIASKAIDVLFDLSGHTALHRLSLFARRAAAVQITWLGWHDTTGLATMDYLLTDYATIPPVRQSNGSPYLSETALYLPSTRLCMMPPLEAPEVNPLPALQQGYLTFGSMQIVAKISTISLQLWSSILRQIPSAHLHIRTRQFSDPVVTQNFQQRAAQHGLDMTRVQLLPPLGRSDYLASFASIDILLDTYPYPGGTTTAEALWMGVPTITMGGNTMISRQGVSLLTAAGLPHWIAKSEDDYMAKAVYWAEHLEDLAALRSMLREQVAATALFDGASFARDFEAAISSVKP